jgi:hypothetical protein
MDTASMPRFFWIAQAANIITCVVSLAALLIVVWLGPRRWTNISFALLLSSLTIWMGGSMMARLFVNVPQLGGNAQFFLNWLTFGFALIGITLFWFVESFDPLDRRWFWAANIIGIVVYTLFFILLARNEVISNPRRGSNGGLLFTITTLGKSFSALHYVYDILALFTLFRRRAWRKYWHLMVGVITIFATSVVAVAIPGAAIQTYMIMVGTLFMTYEVVKQQLFNPLLQSNQYLEAEVKSRTVALAQSLAEQERVHSELAIARDIQLSLLPRTIPQSPRIEVAGRSIPAQEVGGDFYTFHDFPDGRLCIAVGDVSGKGIPAALLMAFSLRTFEMLVDTYRDQGALLTALNTALAPRLLQSNMQTAFLGVVVNSNRGEASIANAGMVTPLLWRDGNVCFVDSFGLPLGALPDTEYVEITIPLQQNDMLLLVSDGIVETMNHAHELWGFGRLEATFGAIGKQSPQEVVEEILAHVHRFAHGGRAHDDMTVVAIRLHM